MKFIVAGKEIEIANDVLSKAIEDNSDSMELSLEGMTIRTEEEETTFVKNTRDLGFADGTEIGRKEVLKGLGIEPNGAHKNDTKTIEALNSFIQGKVDSGLADAGKEPTQKLKEARADIETLKGTISAMEGDYKTLESKFSGYKKSQTINSTLSSLIPDNTVIPKGDMLTLMSSKIKADVDENGVVFALDATGQPIKDPKTLALKPIKDVVTSYFDENPNYLSTPTGGAGGKDSTGNGGNGKQSLDEFISEMADKNVAPNTQAFNDEMMKRQNAGTLDV
jgi:hypothetical protein